MKLLAELLSKLKDVHDSGESLLARSMVLYGSNFGDANKHTTTNMPVILAGGGFKHGQHLAFDSGRKTKALKDGKDQKIENLEAKLTRKNEVMAELMEAHTLLKKELGEL